ncbi:MAG: N-acetylglucosamine-6-phosphate deacetylase [Candidatus Thermoplasmatota archaeon]|nr:N-acetylglucosamine-6-phosphate deacetylase [Candidatus Thermoplasmatota archaeon]
MDSIISGRIVLPDRVIEGSIEIEDGRIKRIESTGSAGSRIIAPGLIDIHIHGCHGKSVMKGEIDEISEHLAEHGVTSFLPTTITAPEESLRSVVKIASALMGKEKGSNILGVNLEGPWVSRDKPGAQPLEHIRKGSIEEFERINNGCVRIITLAPEENMSIIKELSERCIVSLGHSNADYETAKRAIELGAKLSTHTFNTMRPLHHREPGLVGAVLEDERVYCEFIPDFVHLHPALIKLIWRAKGEDRAIAITDGTEASGLEDGVYDLSLGKITVSKGRAVREDGTIAGSAIILDSCIKNLYSIGFSLCDIFRVASFNPSELLGLKNKGRIAEGADADLVLLDKDLNIEKVFIKGVER